MRPMTAASTAATISARAPRLIRALAATPLGIALAVTALITAARLTGTVDTDVAWQLWIAGRMHAGANLYHDIIETNPPLWFWMAIPVDRLATLLHLRIETVLIVTMGALVAVSLAATDRLIGQIAPRRRALLLTYAALILAATMHVGQREQIVLISTLPYIALVAARREGKPASPLIAALIGVGAALGFALKHYFLIVPAALELWLLTGQGRGWRPLRPETVAIVSVGLAYALAIFLFEPDFLTKIVPLNRLAYGDLGAPGLRYMFGPLALAGLVPLAFAVPQYRLLAKAPFASALVVAGFGFAAVYFIQFKGWTYHAVPLLGCGSLALAALLAEIETPWAWLRMIASSLLILPFAASVDEAAHPQFPNPDLIGAVSGLQPGDAVGFLTTETAIPWSVTLQGQYRYASRYNGFWMIRAIMLNERAPNPDPRLVELGRRIVAETAADFACIPPKRIIVNRPRPGEGTFDMLPFFLRDPNFAAVLSHYKVRSRTSLETYELASALPRPAGPCRNGV